MKNKIILLIPHYNNLIGLQKSIKSIGKEEKVDILIVDDGSDEKQIPRESNFKYTQGALNIVKYKHNKGIENALNYGIKYLINNNNYKYIARLDAGDTCKEDRFYIQETFLENNEDIFLIGSHVNFLDSDGVYKYTYKVPLNHKHIKRNMFVKNSFIHPSVMYRSSIFNMGYYPIKYKYTEDYALFYRIVNNYKTANIDEVLMFTEISKDSISYKKRKIQLINRFRLTIENTRFNMFFFYGIIRILLLLIIPNFIHQYFKIKYYKINENYTCS